MNMDGLKLEEAAGVNKFPPLMAISKNGLELTLQPSRDPTTTDAVRLLARFTNHGLELTNLALQAAVPRSMKLQIQALSASTLQTGESASQVLKVTASPGVKLKLRLKLSFSRASETITEQADFSDFPALL
jgi:AP-1 complex subunit gamma-1